RVYAVEDADVAIAERGQGAFHPRAELRPQRLARVGGTDGRHDVAVRDAALQETEPAPELAGVHGEDRPGQAEPGNDVAIQVALVGEVVDGRDQPDRKSVV